MKKTQYRTTGNGSWLKIVFVFAGAVFLFSSVRAFGQKSVNSANHYEIGVLADRGKDYAVREWSPLAEYLTQHFTNTYFSIVPLDYNDIDVAIDAKKIDFIIANPLVFVELAYFDDVQRIATLKRIVNGKEQKSYSSVVFFKADRNDITDVASIVKKHIGAVHQRSFGGWILAAREFQLLGFFREEDFGQISFLGTHDEVVEAVQKGIVDVGIVRSGILEQMQDEGKVENGEFKIVYFQKTDMDKSFFHSMALYPEWSLGKLAHVPDRLAERVDELLFQIPAGHEALKAAGCSGWALPANYSVIRRILREMQDGFLRSSIPMMLYAVLSDYWQMAILFLFAIVYMVIVTINRSLLNRRLMRSKEILQNELIEHKKAEESLRDSRRMLQNVLDLIPARVFWKDRNSVFLGCNQRLAEDARVHSPKDVLGKTDYDFAWSNQARHYQEDDRSVMDSGKPLFNIIEPQTREGEEAVWLRTHKIPMRNEQGDVVGLLGTYEDITESKKAQEDLQKSEAKYRELVENANSAILRINANGEILFFNEFAQKFFGFTEKEVKGKNMLGTIVPFQDSDGKGLKSMVETVIQEIMAGSQEYRIHESENIKKNGERVWVSWSNQVIVNDKGESEILTVGNDVTEHRRLEEELMKLSYSVEQSQNSVMITDTSGHIQYVNPKFTELTGYKSEEVMGKNPRVLKSRDVDPEEYEELWKRLSNGETWRGEFHNRKKNGELFWERATISPVRNKRGEITHYLAIKEDVTQEKKLAQDLQKAFGRLKEMERIINLSGAIVFMWSPQESNMPVKFVSDNIRLIGWEPEDFYLKGMKIRDFILEDDRRMVAETVKRNIKERRLEFAHQYRIKTRDNKIRWLEDHSFVTYAKSGDPEYIQGVAFDITDRRIAQERILEAVNMKAEFISIVSHELRTPLTAVKEGINIVIEEEAGVLNEAQKKFLGIAKRNVDRLGSLINDVLDYQKLDAGRLHFDQKGVDIRPLVKEVFKTMELVARNKGLELKTVLPQGSRSHVFADSERIIQVLNNLVSNAIKFTEQGSVVIGVVYLADRVQISVRDTGPGIKAKDMHKLFQTFSQIRSGSERRSGETGLGLAISKKIIDSHGGTIWAESTFGQGSVFVFTLPFAV